ncbi:MAG: bifunctional methylenetetrahydrofolate dehydrogenase/methenyltetrahydrofolate cyclohydrolase FolD [Clostridia bacterium]|nr:bifunctional methylenetetrahydrofolate dehydrogenase/methenyltetrahydrofolate cyclohydrolase FolD [Clostridia bacterium]
MAVIINGKEVSASIRREIKEKTQEFINEKGYAPGLAVIIVGEDPASQVYVNNKHKACLEVGFLSEVYRLPAETTMDELLSLVDKLNNDKKIHGILCQLPLPKHLNEEQVILRINPDKDVDAFHPINTGKIMIGNNNFVPCTPAGVMKLIESTGTDICGKECVVVGRSNIVGKPQAMLLLQKNGTVTICHSKTRDLKEVTKRADILVVAVGISNFITGDMIKEGAIVMDVGINRTAEGKLTGDVDFESAEKVASYITPVPGGVGPMTITMLLENTLTAAKIQAK